MFVDETARNLRSLKKNTFFWTSFSHELRVVEKLPLGTRWFAFYWPLEIWSCPGFVDTIPLSG